MDVFEKAFGHKRRGNTKKRTLSNIFKGLNSGYVIFYDAATKDYLNGNLHEALSNINKAIDKSDINDWCHYAFRANVYEDLKNYQQAISDYKQAIEYALDDITVYALYHQIGHCYLNLNNNHKASEFYTYSINLKKQHPNTENCPDQEGLNGGVILGIPLKKMYNNRGNASLNLGLLNDAITDCEMAINLDKNYSNAYLLAAQIYAKKGNQEQALTFMMISANLGNRTAISMLQRLGFI